MNGRVTDAHGNSCFFECGDEDSRGFSTLLFSEPRSFLGKDRQNRELTVGVSDVGVDVEGGLYVLKSDVAPPKVRVGVESIV